MTPETRATRAIEALDYPPLVRGPAPVGVFVTAAEVLTWIALGKAITKEALDAESAASRERWAGASLCRGPRGEKPAVQEALQLRASSTPAYAALLTTYDYGSSEKPPLITWANPLLGPQGPRALRDIRRRARANIRCRR